MPLTPSQVENHVLWAKLDELDAAVGHASSLAGESSDLMLAMVPLVVSDCRALLDIPSWRFTNTTILDNLNSQISALVSQIETAAAAEDKASSSATLNVNLINSLDQIAAQLNTAPRPIAGARDGKGITIAAREISDLHRAEVARLREHIEGLEGALNEQEARHERLKSEVVDLETQIETERARATTLATVFESEFSNKSDEWDKEATAERERLSTIADASRTADHQKASAIIVEIKDIHEQAKGLISATAERTTAQDFENYADEQQGLANRWSIGTVILGAAAVGLILLLVSKSHESSSLLIALKALGSLGLLGVMTFAARQVSYHKSEAKDARQISLSVKALGPFISELPEAEQRKIRVEVAQHVFERPFSSSGRPDIWSRRSESKSSTNDAHDE